VVFVAENFDGQLPPVPCSVSMSRRSAAMSRLAAFAVLPVSVEMSDRPAIVRS